MHQRMEMVDLYITIVVIDEDVKYVIMQYLQSTACTVCIIY